MWTTAIIWTALTLGIVDAGFIYNYGNAEPLQTQAEWCMKAANHRDPAERKLHAKYCDGI